MPEPQAQSAVMATNHVTIPQIEAQIEIWEAAAESPERDEQLAYLYRVLDKHKRKQKTA